MATSLPYHEPGIVTILIQTSFLLLLNVANFVLDHSVYCGLLGQIFVGVAWGTPGAKWLSEEAEQVVVQLGYLGLLLLVYEGGLSTSLGALRANLWLSSCVAITGISVPMGLSFVFQKLSGATPLQAFAAGAALCSTSLGTTFTVLRSTGLITSRLGVVLTSAAMMDDVVGLVMVQIISNLGSSGAEISAITIVRPLLVSIAFAVCAPVVCVFVAKPFTLWLNSWRVKHPLGHINQICNKRGTPWVIHTFILVGCITGSTYAGTSNLFAAYIAGAAIKTSPPVQNQASGQSETDYTMISQHTDSEPQRSDASGMATFERYYMQPLERILKPFFFASIGFSIPITEMFKGSIVWKGIVYTALMMVGKLLCGAWLLRISIASLLPTKLLDFVKHPKLQMAHFWGRVHEKPKTSPNTASSHATQIQEPSSASQSSREVVTQTTPSHSDPAGTNPRSIYPASILGCAMTARGEIGFLISSIAESNKIFSSSPTDSGKSSEIFLIVTWAIMLCTILGPLSLGLTVRRVKQLQQGIEKQDRLVQKDVLGVWGVS
ncbi:sodium/hydrogen exchanger family domain-containing protein [Trichoderma breve]|uniref:Sodium/hydrogen exchanger family domain-containing protein n=1 Tax=Trichoderma breve TaxID=2034170 RepID=A0A9W9BF39_9HYPO|nr:sodium/hydrogen exchanger family domain-containing protein [Trichoderma breve]KAJ4862167.1 sodium/hydrogen exchanger family domain-containing protein [Trichoderma breve]